jgi:hypothetical protein
MVKEDRRAFPSSSSEIDDDDDTELVRKKLIKPNLRWKDSLFQGPIAFKPSLGCNLGA